MIVPLTHHLLALIASDAAVLKRILPRGVKLGLNISPAHLQADSFRDDMLRFAAALPADHFHVVLEVTERAMIDKEKSMANFALAPPPGDSKSRLMISAPGIAR